MKKKSFFLIAGLALFLSLNMSIAAYEVPAQTEQPQEETRYTNESVGRVSMLEGQAFIQRAADIGYEEAVVNDPVTEGDRIGTTNGRLEIQFGSLNYLRLDNDTKLDIMNLPRKDSELTRFRIWSGHVYFTINKLSQEKSVEIHTPDSSFYVLERGIYRIDVEEGRGTEIMVFKGLVEAAGEQNSYLVKGEQRLEMAEGRFNSKPSAFRSVAEDSFDRWNEARNKETSRLYAGRYLPNDMAAFEAELNAYGDWVYVEPYGYVWVPRDLDDDWRPYYYGRWVWVPLTGWTWVPFEPWGWATFHYGRWHWVVGIGWYWIPTYIWGPAWVSWWWNVDYFCWAPLSWYGHPVVVINGVFYDRYTGYYPVNSRALVVVRKDQLKSRDISKTALRAEQLRAANLDNKLNLSHTSLPFRPQGSKLAVENLDGKKVMLRQNNQSIELKSNLSGTRGKVSPGTIRPSNQKIENADKGVGSKGTLTQPKSSAEKPATATKPSKTNPASGKVTPKKIRKKKDQAPLSSLSNTASGSQRSVPMYPSSSKISSSSVNRQSGRFLPHSPDSSQSYNRSSITSGKSRSFNSGLSGVASSILKGRSLGSSSSQVSRPGSSSKSTLSRRSNSGTRSIGSFRSSSSRSGSISRKK